MCCTEIFGVLPAKESAAARILYVLCRAVKLLGVGACLGPYSRPASPPSQVEKSLEDGSKHVGDLVHKPRGHRATTTCCWGLCRDDEEGEDKRSKASCEAARRNGD